VARRRAVADDVAWSNHARHELVRAQGSGFWTGEWECHPPRVDDRPTREWCAAFYMAHRDRFVEDFKRHPCAGNVWPVATFELAGPVRDKAVAVRKVQVAQDAWDLENIIAALERPELLDERPSDADFCDVWLAE
jgi:hypothetical protein